MSNKNGKMFASKCCGADILYNISTSIDRCSKCGKVLSDAEIIEDKDWKRGGA